MKNKKTPLHLIAIVLLLFSITGATAADKEADNKKGEMVTRFYPVDPSLFNRQVWTMLDPDAREEDEGLGKSLKLAFERFGVPFPPGSSIAYEPVTSELIVHNVVANLERFEEVLQKINIQPRQVAIIGAFVEFTLAELKTIPGIVLPELATSAQLVALREAGKGKAEPFRLVTINGVNAVVENVEEIIYPTEFDMNSTDGAGSSKQKTVAGRMGVIPGAFETREIGQILNVTPTISPDNRTINLTVLPEMATLEREIDYGFTTTDENGNELHMPMKQPVFASRNVTTSMMVNHGETVVVSGGWNENTQAVTYIFISARLIDPAGRPLHQADKNTR